MDLCFFQIDIFLVIYVNTGIQFNPFLNSFINQFLKRKVLQIFKQILNRFYKIYQIFNRFLSDFDRVDVNFFLRFRNLAGRLVTLLPPYLI